MMVADEGKDLFFEIWYWTMKKFHEKVFALGIKSIALINRFFQLELRTMLTTGVLTSGASEVGVSVIVTTTAEEQEAAGPSPCVRGITIAG